MPSARFFGRISQGAKLFGCSHAPRSLEEPLFGEKETAARQGRSGLAGTVAEHASVTSCSDSVFLNYNRSMPSPVGQAAERE